MFLKYQKYTALLFPFFLDESMRHEEKKKILLSYTVQQCIKENFCYRILHYSSHLASSLPLDDTTSRLLSRCEHMF